MDNGCQSQIAGVEIRPGRHSKGALLGATLSACTEELA